MPLIQAAIVPPMPHWQWLPWQDRGCAESRVRDWLAAQLGCRAQAIPLQRDGYGRPRLGAPWENDDVGWSHSGQGLLVAYARGLVLGIDLERERAQPRALELAQRFFAPSETQWLAIQPETTQASAFLRLWCAKEAVLKAHGRGLAFGLHRLAFAIGEDGLQKDGLELVACDPALGAPSQWQLHEWAPQPGYRAAMAWRTPTNPMAPEPASASVCAP